MSDSILQVRDLVTGFDTDNGRLVAVDGVSFDVPKGKTVGIVGESGCGKSVTAMSIVQLLPQPMGHIQGGEILFDGENLVGADEKRLQSLRGGEIGVIFQEPMTALNPVHRIGKQISESLILHRGMSKREALEKSVELLKRVGIPAPEKRVTEYPHQLSGGMRQRVVIAIALACDPKLVIADEPTTALDVTVQAQILDLLKDLQRESGMSTIMITHDLGVIAETCDEVVVMYAGRVVERAPVVELFTNPQHAYTKGLLNSIPRLENERKTKLNTIPGLVASIADFVPGCRFCQRMNRTGDSLKTRPQFVEASANHWVEACPECTDVSLNQPVA
ncbi:ABC transporter ATP-binding protein [Sulfuriroseicoccus oceanibius]|uniref:ABC transporter ATP-binding protein n=1 Tax=Sulfuriroseicoccus oceanibius TaxID=2707525 RepID=A0A6B3LFN8_9BACT|nr:ABC transporter ATP-binding protein [Sulfuriroseicoccus oceanibius]QQL44740.1 ABC transporter ATP-binding protein [Sulfuriroseicoccus oceanibius]